MVTNKNIILVSQFINDFGSGFSRVALIILITTWFHAAIYVGIYSFCLFVPGIILAAPIGHFVDQQARLKPFLLKTSLAAAVAVLLILGLVGLRVKNFPLLIVSAILYDTCSSFYGPIITKLTVRLFDATVYSRLNAAISTAMMSANLLSGVLVTALMTILPLATLFLADFLSYLIVFCLLLGIHENIVSTPAAPSQFTGSAWNGFGYVRQLFHQFPALVPVLMTALLFNILLAPNDVYFTQLATMVFHNAKTTGLMTSAFSVGFLLGSLLYRWLAKTVQLHTFIQLSLIEIPIAFFMFGESRWLLGSLFGVILLGSALPFFNISNKTILQKQVPEEDLATVSNSYYALINLSQPIGLLGIPLIIDAVGMRPFTLLASITYLAIAGVIIATKKISPALDR
ncbi:MFS transporter [Levilactobacillus fujinensis]|uniref:MFS transporter n=1 Tax=Levilactobacillus fujinensis TaxID=2486024 RepID=A0ABW1THV0_9LACO|nr:MFS transporter [Levilactobacillus fujinensis]